MKRVLLVFGAAVLGAALFLGIACGGDDGDSAEAKQELIDVMTKLAITDGSTASQEDIDYYMAHITDAFVQEFGAESVEACRAAAAECIGEPLTNVSIDPETVDIDGESATLVIASDLGSFGINLTKEGDEWKADDLFVPNDDIPEGTEVVDLALVEFAFEGDLASDALKSGDFALHVVNSGEQAHEVALVPIPEERGLEELLQDPTFEPEPVFVKFPYAPGEESDVALPAPLEPGRYALVCFLPDTDDPELTPHAFKGMVAEFTVE